MWRKIQMSRSQNGDQPKMTETHAKHKTNGVSVTKENEQGNQIVLMKTNARVTPTQGETMALVAKFGEARRFAQNASLLFSLFLLKSFPLLLF